MTRTPTYYSWHNMVRRCTDPSNPAYDRYGGRGITVCDRWVGADGFVNFLADMGDKPDQQTLERINNGEGYSPDNCRWATRKEQAANTRHVTLLDIDIEWVRAHPEKSRKQLADALDVTEETISNIRNHKGRFSDD